jgi:hypothetical protein
MNYDPQESLAYAKRLLAEHRRVHGLVSRIEQQWPLVAKTEQPSPLARLREDVEELRVELARHFAEEEEGGVLEVAAIRCPDCSTGDLRIVEEHPTLLAELDQIVAELRAAADAGRSPSDVRAAFERFVERLHAHESRENRLLERGFGIEMS